MLVLVDETERESQGIFLSNENEPVFLWGLIPTASNPQFLYWGVCSEMEDPKFAGYRILLESSRVTVLRPSALRRPFRCLSLSANTSVVIVLVHI